MATRTVSNAGGNWNSTGSWVEGAVPTAADDVVCTATSGNLTISATAVCRSANFTAYLGTLTHNSGISWSIGDATAGLTNVALKFVGTMTYTLGNVTTSAINFISTSVTQQTVATASKTLGNVTFNGVGGSWLLSDSFSQGATATLTLTAGTLNTNGQTLVIGAFSSSNSNTRVLTLGASSITCARASATAWTCSTATGMTLNAGTSTVVCNGTTTTTSPGALTYYGFSITGSGTCVMGGGATFTNLTRTGTAAKTDTFTVTGNTTVTGTLTLNGNSDVNRIFVISDAHGQTRTFTITGATVAASNVNFRDITLSVSTNLSAVTGGSSDGGGNSGITFTAAANQYWSSNTGSWSDNTKWFLSTNGGGGAGRVPLMQDTAIFDANSFSSGSQTVTLDMPRAGGLNCTGVTNSPTFTSTVTQSWYQSVTLVSGITWSNSMSTTFNGATDRTLTTAGKTFVGSAGAFTIDIVGGTLTLGDNGVVTTGTMTLSRGGFNTGTYNLTTGLLSITGTGTRAFTSASGTVTLSGTGSVWDASTVTGLTFSVGSTVIAITDTSASSKTFVGGGLTYYDVVATATGNGTIIIQGSNAYRNLTSTGGPKTFTITAGTTQTFTAESVLGSSGNLVTFQSSSNGNTYAFSQASGNVICDYLSLRDSVATGGATWYAGSHSTNVSGNTGWLFSDPVPSIGGTASLLGVG